MPEPASEDSEAADATAERDAVASPHTRRWRWNASLLVAIASVAVALVYNGIQARDSAKQIQTGQRSLELTAQSSRLANVLDLHAKIVDADRTTTDALFKVRACERRSSRTEEVDCTQRVTEVVQAVTPLEGIAYALRHNLTGSPSDTRIWRKYLTCSFHTARAGVGPVLDDYVPELAAYATEQLPALGKDRRCVAVILPPAEG